MSNQVNAFKPSFTNLEFAVKAFRQLDQLCAERQAWQDNEYKNSTTRLYNLLSAVYCVYESKFVNVQDDDRRTLRQQLVSKLNEDGINVRKSSDTLGLLIRYVFKADRRRLMSYKYAILAAKSNGVSSADLAKWLSAAGGVDEVSRKVSYSQETLDRRDEVLKATNSVEQLIAQRSDVPLGTVNLPISAAGARVVMLAEPCGNGDFKILYVFENPSDGVHKSLIRKAATTSAAVQIDVNAAKKEVTSFINFTRLNKLADMAVA
ncbi:hypothetical protein [Limnohabitans sp. Jir72]|uniref:hypothetical protein n=1 Tax=Limnohabitans sp. Jir72 TaxID=1977909 RepID=UPI000D399E4E|nr:hypothetical protein [Limnohabitans sp. Jir72]PUE23718.1 hypothetical protein B9Z52_17310 [Limnohabitans sp. Jir72]